MSSNRNETRFSGIDPRPPMTMSLKWAPQASAERISSRQNNQLQLIELVTRHLASPHLFLMISGIQMESSSSQHSEQSTQLRISSSCPPRIHNPSPLAISSEPKWLSHKYTIHTIITQTTRKSSTFVSIASRHAGSRVSSREFHIFE
jgi:hypothetical protein